MTATYLDAILDAHREQAAVDARPLERVVEEARTSLPARDFAGALRSAAPLGVIAEVKRRSPSKGDLARDLDPAALASNYAAGGAACVSVLTDVDHFGGSIEDLQAARAAMTIPVLRKDFTVSPLDVADARRIGADAVLLIVAALDDAELADFHALATELDLAALVEVHDEAEAERAMAVGATIIGVNQRDLHTFEVDTARAVRVARSLPADVIRVAESGIPGPEAIPELVAAGFDAVLVGESLVRHHGPADGVRALIAAASE